MVGCIYLATSMMSPCCKHGSIESPCTLFIPTILSDTATSTGSDIKKPVEKLRKAESVPAIAPCFRNLCVFNAKQFSQESIKQALFSLNIVVVVHLNETRRLAQRGANVLGCWGHRMRCFVLLVSRRALAAACRDDDGFVWHGSLLRR